VTLQLADWHRVRGGFVGYLDEALAVLRYAAVDEEVRALREESGLLDRSYVDRLELVGADRLRFLNGLMTCDVKALAPGAGVYGYFTTPQGRILADAVVLALGDRLWLELPPGAADAVAAHLRKYLVADRVEVRPLAALPLALLGPHSTTVLAEARPLPEEPWRHEPRRIGGLDVEVVRQERCGVPAFGLWVEPASAIALAQHLLDAGAGADLRPVGTDAVEIVRVEAGVARFGRDFGPEHLPPETGAEAEAVSYTKGCYLGQEIVARIHYRGQPARLLRGLEFDGEPPRAGAPLQLDGQEVGRATSVALSPTLETAIGLAILHRRAAATGTELALADGRAAVVADLPFAEPPDAA
jgi:folate-binding protein YgfZ